MKVKSESEVLSRVRLLATPWTAAHQAPPSMRFPGKSTGVGCHCLLWFCVLAVGYLVQNHISNTERPDSHKANDS